MRLSRIFRIPIWSRVAHRWILELRFKIEMYWIEYISSKQSKLSLFYKSFVYLWDLNAKSKRRFGWSWCFPSSAGFAPAGRAQHVLETDARLWYARIIGGVATCQWLGVFLCEYTISLNSLPKFPSIHFSQRWTSSGTSENHSVSLFKIMDLNGWVCQRMGDTDLRLEPTKVHGVIFKMRWSTMVIQPFGYHQQSGYITPWVTRTTLLGYDWNCPNFTAWRTAPRWWVNYIIIRDYIMI